MWCTEEMTLFSTNSFSYGLLYSCHLTHLDETVFEHTLNIIWQSCVASYRILSAASSVQHIHREKYPFPSLSD